jgi:hypothetical protein
MNDAEIRSVIGRQRITIPKGPTARLTPASTIRAKSG